MKLNKSIESHLLSTIIFVICIVSNGEAQIDTTSFITTWDTRLTETSDTLSITIPTSIDEVYNYDIDWNNDGVFDQLGISGNTTFYYDTAGIYTIRIRGTFPKISFASTEDRTKIISIDQWGNIEWSSMKSSFFGTSNLTMKAVDAPDLSNVNSLSGMFRSASSLEGNIGHWDVSNITDMSHCFYGATKFNGDLSQWNVSNVTSMRACFFSSNSFNTDIGSWDVSNVTSMNSMFYQSFVFNQDIGQWDVSQVTDMETMFVFSLAFDSDINSWDVSNVTKMRSMFQGAESFNSDLCDWDIRNITNMSGMFNRATAFNGDISCWDVGNVENMGSMFWHAETFNQDVSGWDTHNVEYMGGMFYQANSFDQNLALWKIGEVKTMKDMLDFSGMSVSNYDSTIIGWSNQDIIPTDIKLGAETLKYCNSEMERQTLIDDYDWDFRLDQYEACTNVDVDDISKNTLEVHVFPNPTSASLNLQISNDNDPEMSITIYNQLGENVWHQNTNSHKIETVLELATSGIYHMVVMSGNSISVQKIVVVEH